MSDIERMTWENQAKKRMAERYAAVQREQNAAEARRRKREQERHWLRIWERCGWFTFGAFLSASVWGLTFSASYALICGGIALLALYWAVNCDE